jgi:hypothetical protein
VSDAASYDEDPTWDNDCPLVAHDPCGACTPNATADALVRYVKEESK